MKINNKNKKYKKMEKKKKTIIKKMKIIKNQIMKIILIKMIYI